MTGLDYRDTPEWQSSIAAESERLNAKLQQAGEELRQAKAPLWFAVMEAFGIIRMVDWLSRVLARLSEKR